MGEKKDGGNNRTRKAKGLRGMRETGGRKGGGKMVGFRNGAEGKCSKQNWAHWHIHANKNRVTDDGEGQSVIRIRRGGAFTDEGSHPQRGVGEDHPEGGLGVESCGTSGRFRGPSDGGGLWRVGVDGSLTEL
jgi:hypothetical protein